MIVISSGRRGRWGIQAMSRPGRGTPSPNRTVPSWWTTPTAALRSVDLPAPLGPISPTHSPSPHRQRSRLHDGLAVERDRYLEPTDHSLPRTDRSTSTKNGAPRNAVRTPIGSSPGATRVRAPRSARIRNEAPYKSESGMITR